MPKAPALTMMPDNIALLAQADISGNLTYAEKMNKRLFTILTSRYRDDSVDTVIVPEGTLGKVIDSRYFPDLNFIEFSNVSEVMDYIGGLK